LVQGAWLGVGIFGLIFGGSHERGDFGLLMFAWWAVATLISLVAVMREPREATTG
jgi:hypothetical protein